MKVLEISKKGEQKEREVSRQEIAHEFGLYSRDIRPVYSVKQLSTIAPRENGLIINLGEIKMIIGKDRLVLFNIENKSIAEEFLPQLMQRIENKEMRSSFSMRVIDFALTFALLILSTEFDKYDAKVQKVLYKLKRITSDHLLEALLNEKKHLNKLHTMVREIEESAEEVLRDDQELEYMCFTEATPEEADSILDHAWEQFEDLSHKIAQLDEHIDDTQEIITLKMANRRNAIIRFDLLATMITATLSGLAVVTGIFGMNMQNNFENSVLAFYALTATILITFFVASYASYKYLKKKKLW
jgi:Mg2+ and Co2+ transporter CorA